ncbi:MAG TPA: PspA/IM30 family protein [Bryobacteraceae bacterium]
MTLLDRVATLIRANLNDLVERAENPEKLLRQLLLDMQNQYLQVKTQVAVAIAGQHQLEKKQRENAEAQQDWLRKAELAVGKNQEALARVALERSLTHESSAKNFEQQLGEQVNQVELLREALHRLESKMAETRAQVDVLIAQHRRARLAVRAGRTSGENFEQDTALERLRDKVADAEVSGQGHLMAATERSVEDQIAKLEKADRVDRMLAELKHRLANA